MIRRPRTKRTRRRLLDAGRTLFAQRGPAGVTSHEIAAEAGFAAGTFYLHCKHKRELFRIVFRPGGEEAEAAARVLERLARGVSARWRAAVARGHAWACLDSDVLAQAIVGMWVRVLSWWVDDPLTLATASPKRTARDRRKDLPRKPRGVQKP